MSTWRPSLRDRPDGAGTPLAVRALGWFGVAVAAVGAVSFVLGMTAFQPMKWFVSSWPGKKRHYVARAGRSGKQRSFSFSTVCPYSRGALASPRPSQAASQDQSPSKRGSVSYLARLLRYCRPLGHAARPTGQRRHCHSGQLPRVVWPAPPALWWANPIAVRGAPSPSPATSAPRTAHQGPYNVCTTSRDSKTAARTAAVTMATSRRAFGGA